MFLCLFPHLTIQLKFLLLFCQKMCRIILFLLSNTFPIQNIFCKPFYIILHMRLFCTTSWDEVVSHWSLIEADRSHRYLIAPLKEGKQHNALCTPVILSIRTRWQWECWFPGNAHSQTGGTSRCWGLLLVGGKRLLAPTSLSLVSVAIFITEPNPWRKVWLEKSSRLMINWDWDWDWGTKFHWALKGRKSLF